MKKKLYTIIIFCLLFILSCDLFVLNDSITDSNTEDDVILEHYPFDLEINYDVYDDLIAMNDDLPSLGNEYYVDQSIGDDSNPGTEAEPWATIRQATLTLQAGDTVYVKEGIYNESVYFRNSGNAVDGYITYCPFEDDEVIIDGTGIREFTNGPDPDLINDYLYIDMDGFINSQGKSYIRFEGFIVQNWTTWFGLYFRGPADHIVIRDCIFTGGNLLPDEWGYRDGGHSFVIWAQVGNSGPIDHVILEGNEVYGNDTFGNEQFNIYGEVSNFKIINNIVHDGTNINMDMIGRIEYLGVPFGKANRGLVKGNICYNSGEGSNGSGIYTDGAGTPDVPDNIIIEDNICYDNDYCGIEIGDEHPGEQSGGILVRNNIVYNNQVYGLHIGASAGGGEVNNVKVYNNIVYNNNEYGLVVNLSYNVAFRNNIFYRRPDGAPGGYYISVEADAQNVTFDYNCWYLQTLGAFNFQGTEYMGYESYRDGTGQDEHSIFANPLFVDPDNHDFRLQAGSPCIDAGIDLGSDYSGSAPDIGKYFP